MDDNYVCKHLIKLLKVLTNNTAGRYYAHKLDSGHYCFGTKLPNMESTVARQIAIYLICGTYDEKK